MVILFHCSKNRSSRMLSINLLQIKLKVQHHLTLKRVARACVETS